MLSESSFAEYYIGIQHHFSEWYWLAKGFKEYFFFELYWVATGAAAIIVSRLLKSRTHMLQQIVPALMWVGIALFAGRLLSVSDPTRDDAITVWLLVFSWPVLSTVSVAWVLLKPLRSWAYDRVLRGLLLRTKRFRSKMGMFLAFLAFWGGYLLVGSGFIADSLAYWLGMDRSADRFVTSWGTGGFLVSYLFPLLGLVILLALELQLLFGLERLGRRSRVMLMRVMLMLASGVLSVLLIMDAIQVKDIFPFSIGHDEMILVGFLGGFGLFLVAGLICADSLGSNIVRTSYRR